MTIATITNVNVKQAVPFFGVTNMEASLRFYIDALGIRISSERPVPQLGIVVQPS